MPGRAFAEVVRVAAHGDAPGGLAHRGLRKLRVGGPYAEDARGWRCDLRQNVRKRPIGRFRTERRE